MHIANTAVNINEGDIVEITYISTDDENHNIRHDLIAKRFKVKSIHKSNGRESFVGGVLQSIEKINNKTPGWMFRFSRIHIIKVKDSNKNNLMNERRKIYLQSLNMDLKLNKKYPNELDFKAWKKLRDEGHPVEGSFASGNAASENAWQLISKNGDGAFTHGNGIIKYRMRENKNYE